MVGYRSEPLPRLEGIETLFTLVFLKDHHKSEPLPRLEGIETTFSVSPFLSEPLPRLEGIETRLNTLPSGRPLPVRTIAPT